MGAENLQEERESMKLIQQLIKQEEEEAKRIVEKKAKIMEEINMFDVIIEDVNKLRYSSLKSVNK